MPDPELAVAITCVIALAAVNTAYAIRRRKPRIAREHEQLAALEQQLVRELRAEQRRALDLTLDGDIAALGKDVVWRRFLNIHPELQAGTGQRGGTS